MLLANQTAIVYGGADSIGSGVARAYACEGAHVHLAGRTEATLEEVAQRIRNDGGTAHVTTLDALDRNAVDRHAAAETWPYQKRTAPLCRVSGEYTLSEVAESCERGDRVPSGRGFP
jgi:NADP-dependent 3-hydroxy acid dehydrogenase YdfG